MRGLQILLCALLAMPLWAGHRNWHRGVSVNMDVGHQGELRDCEDLSVRIDGERVPVISEELPAAGLRALKVDGNSRGGLRVNGWNGSGYRVRACKAVGSGVNASEVRASLRGSELSVDGPDHERWLVYFLVDAPRGAELDLSAENSPITIRDLVDATLKARVENGPVTVKNSSGNLDVASTNGPISFSGGSGTVRLAAVNGPLTIKLSGHSWSGSLEGETENGPLSVRVPRDFGTGVVAEVSNGPLSCKAEGCPSTRWRSGDDHDRVRRIELGRGPASIRLSTHNGPLSIRDAE